MARTPQPMRLTALSMAFAATLVACGGGSSPTPPTVQIISSANGIAVGPVSFLFIFNDDVGSSFTASDVIVSNGSAGLFSKLDPTRYTLVITPPFNASGTFGLVLPGSSYTSVQGINGVTTASASQVFDTAPPTLLFSSSVGGIATGHVTFSFNFSEDVGNSLTASDVLVSFSGVLGQVQALTRVSATLATLVVAPPAGSVGRISLRVPAAAFNDLAGNTNPAEVTATQDFDTLAPTLTISSSAAGRVATGPFTLSFHFSEDVGTSFTSQDVILDFSNGSGGIRGTLTRISATQVNLLVTPPIGAAGTVNLSIAVAAFSDLAGNTNALSYFGVQQYDTRPPN